MDQEKNQSIRNLSLKNIVEENDFKLITKYLKGEIRVIESSLCVYTLDSNFIEKNINEIYAKELNSDYDSSILDEIIEKIKNLEELYEEYKSFESLTRKSTLDKSIEEIYQDVKANIFYSIIELRVALGLPLDQFDTEDISMYCDALIFDLINHKYKRLSICDHIIKDGKMTKYKK